jgi:hypothetical protein
MRLLAAFALCAGVTLGCSGLHDPTAPAAFLGPEMSPDYAVYDAVLEALFVAEEPAGTSPRHVIADSTDLGARVDLDHEYFRREFGSFYPIVQAIRADYALRGSVRAPLDARSFHVRGRVELVSPRELASLDRSANQNPDTFWQAFYLQFPGAHGHVSFSRPGYDSEGTHALLSYAHGCGGRCGDWGIVLLERRGDTWVVLRRVLTMMS